MHNFDPARAEPLYPAAYLDLMEAFRHLSMRIPDDPDLVLGLLDSPVLTGICQDRTSTCAERAVLYEALSYGDPGALLACPGPSLSGIIIRELGDDAQRERFFDLVASRKARTFMAVTEPNKGSDAGGMETMLDTDHRLHGEKWLVGNGSVAQVGTVLHRTGPSPFSIGVAVLYPDQLDSPQVLRRRIPQAALQGARLSQFVFSGLEIPPELQLGMHLRPLKRGMMALIRTFYRMRPCVAAMAIGSAQAVLDVISTAELAVTREQRMLHERLLHRVAFARALNRHAASAVDHGGAYTAHVAAAKAAATAAAEQVARDLPRLIGVQTWATEPWFVKAFADLHGFEWMEGATDIQRLGLYDAYVQRDAAASRTADAELAQPV